MKEDNQKFNFEELFKLLDGNPEILNKVVDFIQDKEKINKAVKMWNRYEEIKNNTELLNWAVRKRFEALLTVSALSATLLIVATFNKDLIALDDFVRGLLSALLILIPGSLWLLYYESEKVGKNSLNKIYSIAREIAGEKAVNNIKKITKPSFRGAIPLIVNIIFSVLVLLIIFLIWKEQVTELLNILQNLIKTTQIF